MENFMSVDIKVKGEVLTARLSGEIDHHNAIYMRKAIDTACDVNMPSLVIIDFGGVNFMDSSGIGLVMGRYKNLSKRGAELHISGANPHIYKVMKLSGLERIVKLENDFEKRF